MLSLSEHTLKAHLNRIFRKCNASSRSKLITLMIGYTWLTLLSSVVKNDET